MYKYKHGIIESLPIFGDLEKNKQLAIEELEKWESTAKKFCTDLAGALSIETECVTKTVIDEFSSASQCEKTLTSNSLEAEFKVYEEIGGVLFTESKFFMLFSKNKFFRFLVFGSENYKGQAEKFVPVRKDAHSFWSDQKICLKFPILSRLARYVRNKGLFVN